MSAPEQSREPAKLPEDIEPTAVVLRFPPGGQDEAVKIVKEAKWTHRAHNRDREHPEPFWRLSVWVANVPEGEERLNVLRQLVVAAGLNGIHLEDERNALCWTSSAGELSEEGFRLAKEGYDGEPPEHYSVTLSDEAPQRSDAARFAAMFRGPEDTGAGHA